VLREADEALEKAREKEATEKRLKISKDGRDKLVNLDNTVHEEVENKTDEELMELTRKFCTIRATYKT
jgi:hypothetical protein